MKLDYLYSIYSNCLHIYTSLAYQSIKLFILTGLIFVEKMSFHF